MKNEQKIIKIKKEIIKTDIEKINEEILCLINNARASPKIFIKKLNIKDDSKNEKIKNLVSFFNNNDITVDPLILESNLNVCSKDLCMHITHGDLEKEKDMNIKCLKERLKRLNKIPFNYHNFIIFEAESSIEAIINLFLNDEYRNIVLDPEIKYIGIASGILSSGYLCNIIDITQSLKNINHSPSRYKNIDEYYNYKYTNLKNNISRYNNMSTNYTDKKSKYKNIMFNKEYNYKNDYKKLKHKSINKYKIKKNLFNDFIEYRYKYPIEYCINRKYVRDEYGNLHLIFDKESIYDDGSVLIQPNF